MKKFISVILLLSALSSFFITVPVVSSAEDVPVWKVAFVSLPSYKNTNGEEWQREDDVEKNFFLAADEFEKWIESVTEYPLDIQIEKIFSDYKLAYIENSYSRSGIANISRSYFDPQGYSAYNLDEYDTVVWGIPQKTHIRELGGCIGEVFYVGLVNDPFSLSHVSFTIIHEFMHVTEWWHRDYLRYQLPVGLNYDPYINNWSYKYDASIPAPVNALPYDIPNASIGAVHNPLFYKYYDPDARIFYADWLNNRVADPYYGKPFHTLQYLGMTEEMWKRETPSMVGFTNGNVTGYRKKINGITGGAYDDNFNTIGWETDLKSDAESCLVRSTSIKNAYINLYNETFILPEEFRVAAYSINGGKTWTKQNDIKKINLGTILSRISDIHLTDNYDVKTRKPASSASVIVFPTIEARSATNKEKLRPNYGVEVDSSGETTGKWVLSPNGKGSESVYDGYETALSSNNRTPNGDWQKMPSDGIPVLQNTEKAITQLVRSAPVVDYQNLRYVPASKTWSFKPLTQKKAPKLRANYIKETISLTKGTAISWNGIVYVASKSEQYSITEILNATSSGEAQTIKIWTVADYNKTASVQQIYKLAKRAILQPQELEIKNGRISPPRDLEFLNPVRGTWGSVPQFTSTQVVSEGVRLKCNVRADGEDDTDYLAKSFPLDLNLIYGEYKSGNNVRQGIIKAEIIKNDGFLQID